MEALDVPDTAMEIYYPCPLCQHNYLSVKRVQDHLPSCYLRSLSCLNLNIQSNSPSSNPQALDLYVDSEGFPIPLEIIKTESEDFTEDDRTIYYQVPDKSEESSSRNPAEIYENPANHRQVELHDDKSCKNTLATTLTDDITPHASFGSVQSTGKEDQTCSEVKENQATSSCHLPEESHAEQLKFTMAKPRKDHQYECGQDESSSHRDLDVDVGDWKLKPIACTVLVQQLEQSVLEDLERQGFVYVCSKTQNADVAGSSSGRAGQQFQDSHHSKVKLNFRKHKMQGVTIGDLARGQKCPDCGKYFRSTEDLRLHIGAVHKLAGKTLASPNIIKRNGKFGCSCCEALTPYSSRQGAEQHIIRVHTPSKLCPHCDGTFSSVSTLNRHIATKHLKTKRQSGFRRTLIDAR